MVPDTFLDALLVRPTVPAEIAAPALPGQLGAVAVPERPGLLRITRIERLHELPCRLRRAQVAASADHLCRNETRMQQEYGDAARLQVHRQRLADRVHGRLRSAIAVGAARTVV